MNLFIHDTLQYQIIITYLPQRHHLGIHGFIMKRITSQNVMKLEMMMKSKVQVEYYENPILRAVY